MHPVAWSFSHNAKLIDVKPKPWGRIKVARKAVDGISLRFRVRGGRQKNAPHQMTVP
tara:strand:- start:1692 stop:1862 length:171 start_codon:yes stop_codon:yes gene_type:complete